MTKVAKPVKKAKSQYKASVKIFGRTYDAAGDTLQEAIQAIKLVNAKGKSILIIEKDGERQEKVLPHPMTARLFGAASRLTKEVILKQVSQRFSI